MSFITQIQPSLQVCIISTPHSADIETIVGTAPCVAAAALNQVTHLGQSVTHNGAPVTYG